MPTSKKKVAANRLNGPKSHGPKNTTSTRYNATKHGFLALGITKLDNKQEYETTLDDLIRGYSPIGAVEIFLVRSAALDMVRWRRAQRLEAEYITAVLNPPLHEKDPIGELTASFQGPVVDPGLPASISAGSVESLVRIFQRYESNISNRLFRTLHELERLQRMRQGERLPAPTAVDVSVHAETGTLASVPVAPETAKVLAIDGESMPSPATVTVLPADTGVVDSVPAELGQKEVVLADDENSAAVAGLESVNDEPGVVDSAPPELGQKEVLPLAAPADVDVAPAPWRPRVRSGPIWNNR